MLSGPHWGSWNVRPANQGAPLPAIQVHTLETQGPGAVLGLTSNSVLLCTSQTPCARSSKGRLKPGEKRELRPPGLAPEPWWTQ